MNKWISILLCLVLVLAVTGCGNSSSANKPGSNQPAGVNDVIEQGMAEADSKKSDSTSQPLENNSQNQQNTESQEMKTLEPSLEADTTSKPDGSADGVDVDLTMLSSTMVYSEVYNMMTTPDDYIGKVVKMNGAFTVFHDEGSSDYFFACIVKDATACCAQGIEFLLAGEHSYPKDYPYEGDEICVVGVYDTYKDGDSTYCTLKNAKIV
jgi:hypothetical protein